MSIMKEKPNTVPDATMRRRDRAVDDDEWIRKFLARSTHGVLATAADGQPSVHINTFVYDAATHALYLHTAKHGRLHTNIDTNDRVSFCTGGMGRLLPADTAREFSVEFESVVIFGRGSILSDMSVAREKMQLLMDKYFGHLRPGPDYRPITDIEIAEISVFKIAVDAWSAKRKTAPGDFPGAFHFRDSGA